MIQRDEDEDDEDDDLQCSSRTIFLLERRLSHLKLPVLTKIKNRK